VFKNYVKIAIRNLIRHKQYALINILGLAIGLACFVLIMLWVQDELSFDKFHTHRDSLYRVVCETQSEPFFGSPGPLAPTIMSTMPEIQRATRVYWLPRFVFAFEDLSFYEDNGIVVDPEFFHMFSFPFVKGSLENGFVNSDQIVITESMAQKYFGDADPVNKKINVEGEGFLIVSGVIKDIPANSHLQFDYALPYVFLNDVRLCGLQWGDFNFKTYLQLNQPADIQDVQQKITQVAIDNDCPQIKYGGMSFSLQSLNDMYLHPISNYDIKLGDIRHVYIFTIVALLIFYATYEVLSDTIHQIIGCKADDTLIKDIRGISEQHGVNPFSVHHMHLHEYGDHKEITFHIRLADEMTIDEAYQITKKIKDQVRDELDIEATINIDPMKNIKELSIDALD